MSDVLDALIRAIADRVAQQIETGTPSPDLASATDVRIFQDGLNLLRTNVTTLDNERIDDACRLTARIETLEERLEPTALQVDLERLQDRYASLEQDHRDLRSQFNDLHEKVLVLERLPQIPASRGAFAHAMETWLETNDLSDHVSGFVSTSEFDPVYDLDGFVTKDRVLEAVDAALRGADFVTKEDLTDYVRRIFNERLVAAITEKVSVHLEVAA